MPDLRRILAVASLLLLLFSGCTTSVARGSSLKLAAQTEHAVQVQINLNIDDNGQAWLVAIFTPSSPNAHLYSKDLLLPVGAGMGRPTLLELVPGSQITAVGPLVESIPVSELPFEGLPVYPPGAVTLSLPVLLPEGEVWFDESVSVTYMACTDGSCRPPVEDKRISIRIPGAGLLQQP